MRNYTFKFVDGHYEIYGSDGSFLFSADTQEEAIEELEEEAA